MKKSVSEPALNAEFERFLEDNPHCVMLSRQIYSFKLHLYTRYDKVASEVKEVITGLDSHENETVKPLVLKLQGNNKKIDLFLHVVNTELQNIENTLFSRPFHGELVAKEIENHGNSIELNSIQVLEMDVLSQSRNFESIFRRLNQLGYRYIAINVELLKKGHVVLAEKFDLELVVSGIKHKRHLDSLINSKAKYFLLAED